MLYIWLRLRRRQTCSATLPVLMALKKPMACACLSPSSPVPLMARISSPFFIWNNHGLVVYARTLMIKVKFKSFNNKIEEKKNDNWICWRYFPKSTRAIIINVHLFLVLRLAHIGGFVSCFCRYRLICYTQIEIRQLFRPPTPLLWRRVWCRFFCYVAVCYRLFFLAFATGSTGEKKTAIRNITRGQLNIFQLNTKKNTSQTTLLPLFCYVSALESCCLLLFIPSLCVFQLS